MLSSILVTGIAIAGSAKEAMPPPPPPEPAPEWNWFAGAGAGYLMDFEEPMYHGHLGIERSCPGPWTHAFFLEVGWTEGEESFTVRTPQIDGTIYGNTELEVLPVTLNYKIERRFDNGFYLYAGAGVGFASIDSTTTARFPAPTVPAVARSESSDEVFAGQIFAGLGYNVTPNFEIYGGARWIYLDDDGAPTVAGVPGGQGIGALEDDVLAELGVRFNF